MKQLSTEEKQVASQLKAKLWYTVSRMVEEEGVVPVTPKFVAALVELVYTQTLQLGEDLELFARHAGRKTVTPADVLMVARRNEDLASILREYLGVLNE
jgi:histone H3/H4